MTGVVVVVVAGVAAVIAYFWSQRFTSELCVAAGSEIVCVFDCTKCIIPEEA